MKIFEIIIDSAMAIGVIFTGVALCLNAIAIRLSCVHKCTSEYRRIVRQIQGDEPVNKQIIKYDLLGLFNEQLFYYKRPYLPRNIKAEWKKTMLKHLENDDAYNKDKIFIEQKDWENFERIQAFMEKFKNKKTALELIKDKSN